MHDYDDHKKVIGLCTDLKEKKVVTTLPRNAHKLVSESLKHSKPWQFLNDEFQLNGFFRF